MPTVLLGQSIIPLPNSVTKASGKLVLQNLDVLFEPGQEIKHDDGVTSHFENKFGSLNTVLSSQVKVNRIEEQVQNNAEAYELKIEPKQITMRGDKAGLFYAQQSLQQLLFNGGGKLDCQTIIDAPRFAWRGMHLDVSRHFFSVDFIKKYIDILAMHKMNTFHWHLTDDQGWRIEIKKYPKLTQIASQRKETMVGKNFNPYVGDGVPHGGFYTQEQIKEVVAYAKERFVTVVPEIEMPGHSVAALSAYPQYSCNQKPLQARTTWGVSEDVYCSKDETFTFLFNILDEVMELFPSKYIHIGGDEAPKTRWKSCQQCQGNIKKHGLKDEHELQSYFIKKIDAYLTSKGRYTIGWDEILEGGLAPNAAVMSWRGEAGGIAAAKLNHKVVMSPGSHCYFDHYQGNKKTEPLAIGGYTPLKKTYSYEPIPAALSKDAASYILGAQGNVWTEYMSTPEQVMYMALPRLSALSEVLWSGKDQRNYQNFVGRLIPHLQLLKLQRINYSTALFDVMSKPSFKNGQLAISLFSDLPAYTIRYTTDGTKPTAMSKRYSQAVKITAPTNLQAALFSNGRKMGNVLSEKYLSHLATAKKVELQFPPKKQYSTGGANTLLDGIQGTLPWSGNEWLGWRGKEHMAATVDLGSNQKLSKIKISFLQAPESWIYLPQDVSVMIKGSNGKYKSYTLNKWDNDFTLEGNINTTGRYIKIDAYPMNKIPEGMAGAGQAAWLFCSEIIVE